MWSYILSRSLIKRGVVYLEDDVDWHSGYRSLSNSTNKAWLFVKGRNGLRMEALHSMIAWLIVKER